MIFDLTRQFLIHCVTASLPNQPKLTVHHQERLRGLPAPFILVSNQTGPWDALFLLRSAGVELVVFGVRPPMGKIHRCLFGPFLTFPTSEKPDDLFSLAAQAICDWKPVAFIGLFSLEDPLKIARLATQLEDPVMVVPCHIRQAKPSDGSVSISLGRPLVPIDEEPEALLMRIEASLQRLSLQH